MHPKASTPILSYMKQLEAEGVTNLEELSDYLYEHYLRQVDLGMYSNGRYTLSGSDVQATIISTNGDSSQECILWCINHYLG